jgi:hypothetical protein
MQKWKMRISDWAEIWGCSIDSNLLRMFCMYDSMTRMTVGVGVPMQAALALAKNAQAVQLYQHQQKKGICPTNHSVWQLFEDLQQAASWTSLWCVPFFCNKQ